MPSFKPGTSTWNTDDPSQAPPWVRAQVLVNSWTTSQAHPLAPVRGAVQTPGKHRDWYM